MNEPDFAATSQVSTQQKTVRTEKLEIIDSKGSVRAILGMEDDETILELRDKSLTTRIKARIRKNGTPEVLLFDEDEEARIRLLVNNDDEPKITLRNEDGDVILKLALSSDDDALIEARDNQKNLRVGILASEKGGLVFVVDEDGDIVGHLPKGIEWTDILEAIGSIAELISLFGGMS